MFIRPLFQVAIEFIHRGRYKTWSPNHGRKFVVKCGGDSLV